jgi:hypothetical protein
VFSKQKIISKTLQKTSKQVITQKHSHQYIKHLFGCAIIFSPLELITVKSIAGWRL